MFTIFWEREITSESHGTPVHISTIVYTAFTFLLLFPFSLNYYFPLFFDPLEIARPERLTTSLNSLGAKLFAFLCAGQCQLVSSRKPLAPLPPSCSSWNPTGLITLVSSPREICCYLHHNLPLGVTNEEVLSTPISMKCMPLLV